MEPFDLEAALQSGESETVEFKSDIRNPSDLARQMAAFANTNGGSIAVGVSEPSEIVGGDMDRLKRVYNAALDRLNPTPETRFSVLTEPRSGKEVAVIDVRKAPGLVLSDSGAYQRVGGSARPMSPDRISLALTSQHNGQIPDIRSVSESLASLTEMIEGLQRQLERATSLRGQIPAMIAGGVIGAVLSLILTLLFT